MQYDETPYDRIWVINTPTAAELIPHMLERFRLGYPDPLIFGDANYPEAAIVPIEVLQALDIHASDDDEAPTASREPA